MLLVWWCLCLGAAGRAAGRRAGTARTTPPGAAGCVVRACVDYFDYRLRANCTAVCPSADLATVVLDLREREVGPEESGEVAAGYRTVARLRRVGSFWNETLVCRTPGHELTCSVVIPLRRAICFECVGLSARWPPFPGRWPVEAGGGTPRSRTPDPAAVWLAWAEAPVTAAPPPEIRTASRAAPPTTLVVGAGVTAVVLWWMWRRAGRRPPDPTRPRDEPRPRGGPREDVMSPRGYRLKTVAGGRERGSPKTAKACVAERGSSGRCWQP